MTGLSAPTPILAHLRAAARGLDGHSIFESGHLAWIVEKLKEGTDPIADLPKRRSADVAGYLLAAASRGARGRPGLGDPRETGGEIDTDVLSDDIAAVAIVRPLLRALAWAGSLVAVVGVAGLILTIQYFAGGLSNDRLGGIHPGIYLFVYACFLVLGLAFGVTAWLTRR